MLAGLWRLVHRTQSRLSPRQQDDSDELSWLRPPANPLDVAAWDRFWVEHMRHGIGPPLLDMFCDDSMLVRVMNDEGIKSILCAGNGISQEPKALAAAGMDVVAMDISPQAAEIAKNYPFPLEAVSQYYEPELQKLGGKVEFVTGDILDSAVCPGPFDVIIERLTAQNYYTHDIGTVLNRLAQRLSENGIFSAIAMTGPGSHQPSRVISLSGGFTKPDGRSGTGSQAESLRVELPGYLRRQGKAHGTTGV